MKDNSGPAQLPLKPFFVDQLKAKSRRRRKDLVRMSKAEASPRALRNDLLPRLELAHMPLDYLKAPAREVRKLHPAHVRQIADAIGALALLRADPRR